MGLSGRLKQWLADGNVIVKPNGRYATQCHQYTNSLDLKELVSYYMRHYVG
jgi:hypothetical protein